MNSSAPGLVPDARTSAESAAIALIDPSAIARSIEDFARITEPGAGVTRLAYTELEREAHRLFAEEMSRLGLTVTVDAVGNSIAELPGGSPGRTAAVGTGSHLDSVPSGGRFDGIAGVSAAIETARVMVESGMQRRRPWRFVVFAAEEGARFGQACNGSRVAAGLTTSADLATLVDKDGISIEAAMARVGLQPDAAASARWRSGDWAAFIELHIEQGNVLETNGARIGAVDIISGSSRLMVSVTGTATHTGATPMHLRRDALVAASECVLRSEQLATDPFHRGTRITVGRLDVSPGSITTIPGRVVFTVDIRDFDSQRQRETMSELIRSFTSISAARGVEIEIETIGDTSPVVLPLSLVERIADAAHTQGLRYRMMPSGASHDAQQISRVTPTGMIFIPSRGGLSHVPAEWSSSEDIAAGTAVLIRALAGIDAGAADDGEAS
ncbi:Zn-dependent hydrolase [Compostimonas suwonensis]|uniref:Allantoate deiminase/N-carbamoyl-L-amino-acid hydrolase n=1 Tax=Compostimonas suwonensis TaxID=1048394 RepID=A0A2M9BZT1_9MICO|nr:Zn-dependent hydrolase [Compostimonas suwonensis]PJJ63597.1 allantoate deiminase/N-carbamoyl-L-amino-acid hydrolase [Compostimonas suwonensis]